MNKPKIISIVFDAIFVPREKRVVTPNPLGNYGLGMFCFDLPKSSFSHNNSYFIVSPHTYKLISGFSPITYNEYFALDPKSNPEGEKYFHQNDIYTDKVNMFSYELTFSNKLLPCETDKLVKMVKTLEEEGKIRRVCIMLKRFE